MGPKSYGIESSGPTEKERYFPGIPSEDENSRIPPGSGCPWESHGGSPLGRNPTPGLSFVS